MLLTKSVKSHLNYFIKEMSLHQLTWNLYSQCTKERDERNINIILDCVFNKKLVTTQLKKRTQPKIIKDTYSKTIFTAKNQLHEQVDGVSMGGSLSPLL